MKEIVILSGKGGTGKTSIAGCFASLAQDKVLCDCDVDAADLHILLQPLTTEAHEFFSGQTACILSDKCTQCGLCSNLCRFDAIHDFVIDSSACEGCGFCYRICPEEAIVMSQNMAGHWFVSETDYGPMIHARLGIAEENSGKLVTTVRNEAKRIAEEKGFALIITDGPPGIGCPVISSLSGADLALIVTEPTLSGMHDMERVIGVCMHFRIPVLVCINKCDINNENTRKIESMCEELGIIVVANIPYNNLFTEALIASSSVTEYTNSSIATQITLMWKSIEGTLLGQGVFD